MKEKSLINKTALVTGGSGGLGADFARQLASRGANLILAARRQDQLELIAHEIQSTYGVSVQTVGVDLSVPGAPDSLYNRLHAEEKQVDILVNNAGFGIFSEFAATPWENEKNMLELDIIVLTHLTKLFLWDMLERNEGYILQVASIGAFQPTPTYATYSAAKAYVLSMSEAINYELRHTGVSMTVVSPGVTATEFLKVAGQKPSLYQRLVMMDSPSVARIAIDALLRRRSSVIPGFTNNLSAFATRLAPRRWQAALANILMTRE